MASVQTTSDSPGSLFAAGFRGVVSGYVMAGGMVLGAAALNFVHNILPVFVFVFPLIILGLIVFAPIAFCSSVATTIASRELRCGGDRSALVSMLAVFWTLLGLGGFLVVMDLLMGPDRSFLADGLVPFFCSMVGAALNFEWGAAAEPYDLSPAVVYGIFGASAGFGLLGALGAGGLESGDLD